MANTAAERADTARKLKAASKERAGIGRELTMAAAAAAQRTDAIQEDETVEKERLEEQVATGTATLQNVSAARAAGEAWDEPRLHGLRVDHAKQGQEMQVE